MARLRQLARGLGILALVLTVVAAAGGLIYLGVLGVVQIPRAGHDAEPRAHWRSAMSNITHAARIVRHVRERHLAWRRPARRRRRRT
jgi:hypothetical protein